MLWLLLYRRGLWFGGWGCVGRGERWDETGYYKRACVFVVTSVLLRYFLDKTGRTLLNQTKILMTMHIRPLMFSGPTRSRSLFFNAKWQVWSAWLASWTRVLQGFNDLCVGFERKELSNWNGGVSPIKVISNLLERERTETTESLNVYKVLFFICHHLVRVLLGFGGKFIKI